MKLIISFLISVFIYSCNTINDKNIKKVTLETKEIIKKKIEKKEIKNNNKVSKNIFYLVGEPYFIEGVEYSPQENYNYNETGLASFYGKDLHNIKTLNNDLNKVTELLGRHKTLPLPSVVKVTNLENGLSLTVKIIDRHNDNTTIIQVSRKVAQLLRFYKNKIARVRVEILTDPSKQWKSVILSMNEPEFNQTIESAPTDLVSITNLEDEIVDETNNNLIQKPIEIGSEDIETSQLYIKIYNFNNYSEIQNILSEMNISSKSTTERDQSNYNLIIGPIKNEEADNLVSSFIMKGYKKTEIILK